MGIRDEELKRLKKYAEGLGLKVTYKPYVKYSSDSAAWAIDGSEIIIYENAEKSKTDLILDFVHELGHHLSFVYNNKTVPAQVDRALDKELLDTKPTEDQRKAILDFELLGMQYHKTIIKEVNIKIPYWKFQKENDFQRFVYTHYWKHGESPSVSKRNEFRRKLKEKYERKRSNK